MNPLLSVEMQREQILHAFNREGIPFESIALNEGLERSAERFPHRRAITHREQILTYEDLNRKANRLARFLANQGIVKGDRVGMLTERSEVTLVMIMAVLKAGAAYIPIDPDYPAERIAHMVSDSQPRKLLIHLPTKPSLREKLQTSLAPILLEYSEKDYFHLDASNLAKNTTIDSEAYVIYTSGTTGMPKGIRVTHRNVLAYIQAFSHEFAIGEKDVVLQQAAISFDIFVEEVFPALFHGSSLVIADKEDILDGENLVRLMTTHGVTLVSCTPQLLRELNRLPLVPSVHTYISGGDVLKREHFTHLLHQARVYNTYGPSETTVCATYHRCQADEDGIVPIGRPILNSFVYILDHSMELASIGEVGEICISGEGVSLGYLNRPESSEACFIPDPFRPQHRMYRTGDLGKWLPDGSIVFIGRADRQVKIRGHRIELSEIENGLLKHPDVTEAVVIDRVDLAGDPYLCAYFESERAVDSAALHDFSSKVLPAYMVPSFFIPLEKIPVTVHGKLDRSALPEPNQVHISYEDEAMPQNSLEQGLWETWAELLGHRRFGIDHSFFHVGGHSLRCAALASAIRLKFQVDIRIRQVFERPTILLQAEFIRAAVKSVEERIAPAVEAEDYIASPVQRRLYALCQMEEADASYHIPSAFVIEGNLDISRMEKAFRQVVERHEILRTSYLVIDGGVRQKVHREVSFELERLEGEDSPEDTVVAFIRPFDWEKPPFLRAGVKRLGADRHLLVTDLHHIAVDGIACSIVMKEVAAIYRTAEALPPPRLQYKDYCVWREKRVGSAEHAKQEAHWLEVFSAERGELPVLHLAGDFPRPALQGFEGETIRARIDGDLARSLGTLAAERQATLYMVLLAAFHVLLHKYTGQSDIVIGSPAAARGREDLNAVVGMFANTLAMRNRCETGESFEAFLAKVRADALKAYENEEYELEELIKKLGLKKDPSRNPLFDVMLVLQNKEDEELELEGLRVTPQPYSSKTSKFDLTLEVRETEDGLELGWEYGTRLFRRETIERMARHFVHILRQTVHNPGIHLSEIELAEEAEKRQLLEAFNRTATAYPKEVSLVRLFEEQVLRTPEAIALVREERVLRTSDGTAQAGEERILHASDRTAQASVEKTLTYRELNERSNRLAWYLRERGIGANLVVGVMVERSFELLISLLGILKAGGAYVSIDPEYPAERIRYIAENSRAALVLSQRKFAGSCGELSGETVYCEDVLAADGYSTENPDVPYDPERLMYLLYTSGSTGQPKGAMIACHAFVNLLSWYTREFAIGADDRTLLIAPASFDLAQKNLYSPLITGGRLVLFRPGLYDYEEMAEVIRREGITLLNATPSAVYPLVEVNRESGYRRLESLRCVFLGGEPINLKKLRPWTASEAWRGEIVNTYGPTECTDIATFCRVGKQELADLESVPIGRPVDNVRVYILDANRQVTPVGVPGEIWIGGAGVGLGYYEREELTQEKFVHVEGLPEARVYRTGDLGRWQADGNVEYLGRADSQVKIRGYRIELGEIEARLNRLAFIREAVVTVERDYRDNVGNRNNGDNVDNEDNEDDGGNEGTENNRGDAYLCAYIECEGEGGAKRARSELARELPGYMLPQCIMEMDKLPLTPNGKIDRKALPKPEFATGRETAFEGPRNEREAKLVRIWEEVLGVSPIGIHNSFFDLGGNSLKAVTLQDRIKRTFAVRLPMAAVFLASVLEQAEHIGEATKTATETVEERIAPAEEAEDYAPSPVQRRLYALCQMEEADASYHIPSAFVIEGNLDISRMEKAFRQVVERHEILRTSYLVIDGGVRQKIHREVSFELERLEGEDSPEDTVVAFIRPFDWEKPPFLRAGVKRLGADRHLLVTDLHHIAADGIACSIVMKEVAAIYRTAEALPPPRLQYKDYCVWREKRVGSAEHAKQEAHWLEVFSAERGELPVLHLAGDFPRPALQGFEGETIRARIDGDLARSLGTLAADRQATLYMMLLAAFHVLLHKYTGQSDIVIGSPAAARGREDLNAVVGMFANTLAMRNRCETGESFEAFLAKVRADALKAYENEEYELEELIKKLGLKKDPSRNPLFDVMLVLQNKEDEELELEGLRVTPRLYNSKTSKFDLTLEVRETEDGLELGWEYGTRLFRQETIERMARHYVHILRQTVHNPGIRLSEIELAEEAEKRQLLEAFNQTATAYPKEVSLIRLFEEQVRRTPEAIALVREERILRTSDGIAQAGEERILHASEGTAQASVEKTLTYRELNERSNRLAWYLRERGIGANLVVGVMVERSFELLISLLGILKAGGAYVSIDPEYPAERIRYIAENSRAALVLSQRKFAGSSGELSAETVYCEDVLAADGYSTENPDVPYDPERLMYLLYTSGSTGQPKGAMIACHAFVNLLSWYTREFAIGVDDRTLLIAPASFDLAQKNLYSPLITGGRLVLFRPGLYDYEEMAEVIRREGITLLNATPSAVYPLVEVNRESGYRRLESLRCVFLGGEPINLKKLRPWTASEAWRGEIVNTYGPTECTDIATFCRVGKQELIDLESVPIGRPVDNVRVYILDANRQVTPVGVPGEIWIGGAGVGLGYYEREELTREKFVHVEGLPEARVYRTGDLGRWQADGNVEYLGRADSQVKIRGYRIELGEIEARLNRLAFIREAVVTVERDYGHHIDNVGNGNNGDNEDNEDNGGNGGDEGNGNNGNNENNGNNGNNGGDTYLCAYIECEGEGGAKRARSELARELPGYMLPQCIMELDKLPLTPNGKIDRKALPKPEFATGRETAFEGPSNEREAKLVRIWEEVLGVSPIGIHDSFFDLGGNSLKAVRLQHLIQQGFQVRLPVKEIFRSATVSDQAHSIFLHRCSYLPSPPAPYTECYYDEAPDCYPVSSAQLRMYILEQFSEGAANYNVPEVRRIRGPLDRTKFEQAWTRLIHRHEALRTSFDLFGDEVVQRVHPPMLFSVEYRDLSHMPLSEKELTALMSGFVQTFDLSEVPLLRGFLIKLNQDEHLILLDMHHIVTDHISNTVLFREWKELYHGQELPAPHFQYKDYAIWEKRQEQSPWMERQKEYWLKALEAPLPEMDFPVEATRTEIDPASSIGRKLPLSLELSQRLIDYSRDMKTTLFVILTAAANLLLVKILKQDDIIVGIPVTGRNQPEFEDVVGVFINTIALRNRPSSEKTVTQFVDEVKESVYHALENQSYPFDQLVERLGVSRTFGENPLFHAMVDFHEEEDANENGLVIENNEFDPPHASKVDLLIEGERKGNQITLFADCKAMRFNAFEAERILVELTAICERIVGTDDTQTIAQMLSKL
ncbi:non-ribosomal peptide synthetase [Gorillibacterium timonense]|uniref:non-ribosomal peptide synthetase n=1 Tax=Gorillibacterium timonense TaxID=1689269 RepID=UPI00071C879D|nr:non-ribosomal peptide synthetase [Gorillibacterium timonense]